jgi:ATP-dependent DNA ligase
MRSNPATRRAEQKFLTRPEWVHKIKHDGYRLIVQRDGKRVRLFTRNGHDWSSRYRRGRATESKQLVRDRR